MLHLVGKVWLRVNRVDPETCSSAAAVTVADLHEAMVAETGEGGMMSARMRPVLADARIAGPAITAWCPSGDNLMMHRALSLARRGDVLVVVCEGEDSAAQWGDVATAYAMRIGLAGVIVHGAVRDTGSLRRLQFPVWSTVVAPAHPEKKERGVVNAPLVCADANVSPGDLVAADGDGVIVVPRRQAAAVVTRARARAEAEDKAVVAIQNGAKVWDLSGAAASYSALEVEEYDAAYDDDAERR